MARVRFISMAINFGMLAHRARTHSLPWATCKGASMSSRRVRAAADAILTHFGRLKRRVAAVPDASLS